VSGDQTYRVIPTETTAAEILMSHSSIGFDRVPFQRDINVTFPLDRFRELVERGTIGSLAPNAYSFMGAQRSWDRIQSETAPEVAKALLSDGVDVVFLTPT
jgi:D-proline reductase (dithiol) PrdB